ncbi:MAG: DUF4214 domain-containing protein [Clostridiales bacterium]|nr:DUF4214 domain-containing protein [Clostridiales bacterium]
MRRRFGSGLVSLLAAVSIIFGCFSAVSADVAVTDCREMVVGQEYRVDNTHGALSNWFEFTPGNSDIYAFRTVSPGYDPILLLFDEQMNLLSYNADINTNESNESYLAYPLEAGTRYYIKAMRQFYSDDSLTYRVIGSSGYGLYVEQGGVYGTLTINQDLVDQGTDCRCTCPKMNIVKMDIIGADADTIFVWYGPNGLLNTTGDHYEFQMGIFAGYREYYCLVNKGGLSVRINFKVALPLPTIGGRSGNAGYEAFLLDPGAEFVFDEEISNPSDASFISSVTSLTGNNEISEDTPFTIGSVEGTDVCCYLTAILNGQMFTGKSYFLFVLDDSVEEVTVNTPHESSFDGSSYTGYQVLSFTPEQTGHYTVSSEGLEGCTRFTAMFDPDRSIIASFPDRTINSSDEHEMFILNYVEEMTESEFDAYIKNDVTFEVDLEAGRTYYLCTMFNGQGEGTVTFTYNDPGEPDPTTDTPTPEPASDTPAPSTPAPSTPAPSTPAPVTEPASPSEGYSVSDFVERLYTVALGRSSDPVGKSEWIAAVTERGETGADLARGFLYSPEFLNKDVSNTDFVKVLYRTFFNREPDAEGLAGWVAVLDNGEPKQNVIEGFINSTEWANLCLLYGIRNGGTGVPSITVEPNERTIEFATRLYTTCLGRAAEEGGMMAWARQLSNQRDTGTGAAHGFFFSEEFTRQNVSNAEFVNRLYRTFMGREADEAGFSAWVAQLDSGVSREEVFNGFAGSVEFGRICADYGIIR